MAPADAPSNIRVFVHWREQTVFAGEEIRCTITFRNIALNQKQQSPQHSLPPGERQRLVAHGRPKAATSTLTSPPSAGSARGHRRSALSLSVPSPTAHNRSGSIQWPHTPNRGDLRTGRAHQRSVSIVSIGSVSAADDHTARPEAVVKPQRPARGHARAASLQILPRAQSSTHAGPASASLPQSTAPTIHQASLPLERARGVSGPSTVPSTPNRPALRRLPLSHPRPVPDFHFPQASPTDPQTRETPKQSPGHDFLSPRNGTHDDANSPGHNRPREQLQTPQDRPSARLLSSTSVPGGTPRSSGEFYSVSNHSSETLASEYISHPPTRGNSGRQPSARRSSGLASQQARGPESLMMGYAQIQGSFSVDGSLVNLGPFEQVKKKAAVGGRGGVVGLEAAKRETGLLRGFGWGNISNTIGDLWGGGELSTIKEIRGVASSKSVPLLSTPQSILFVDMQLSPGESRAFEYSFKLPRGLPPSHRGKAAKFSYSLVIGTQRAGGVKEQEVRSVEVPFRVLGSVNGHGEILGHDLMNPYVLLRDEAEVKSLDKGSQRADQAKTLSEPSEEGRNFLDYVDRLVARRKDAGSGAGPATLLSPTEASDAMRSPGLDEATNSTHAIRLAIMRSTQAATQGQQSASRFEIARNGQRVGVVMLTRPAYRLGEVVTMIIDFSDGDIPCYAVHATLETSEKVEAALAVRSESSIQRVTRKVYAASSEATLYSRRVVFSPTIPITATPEFVTSSISLDWRIRVEFVVPHQGSAAPSPTEPQAAHPLLEQVSQDEKGGLVLVAVEGLACESFDVSVPLRVYGAVGSGLERLERDEASERGLAV